jgi:hypothetical protein
VTCFLRQVFNIFFEQAWSPAFLQDFLISGRIQAETVTGDCFSPYAADLKSWII